jgi:DNA modification methylase
MGPLADAPRRRRALSHQAGALRRDGVRESTSLLASAFRAAREADARELTHGFHSYPARFHPLLVRTLLGARARAGMIVCDPFCGSGTTLVETLLVGGRGVGSDLNPLALELARIKALAPTAAHRRLPDELTTYAQRIADESRARVKARKRTRTSGGEWDDPAMYAPHVFRELVGLRELLDDPPGGALSPLLRRALLLCFSAILIKVSRQSSETGQGTQERAIGKALPTRLFERKAIELADRLRALHARVPAGTPGPIVQQADARRLRHVESASVPLIVTSPPYLGTYDYASHHQRRMGWLGLRAGALRENEIGARRRAQDATVALRSWQTELDAVVAEWRRVLVPGGSAFVIIGDSRVGQTEIPGDRALREAASRVGLELVGVVSEERRRANGSRAGDEHLVELRAPA